MPGFYRRLVNEIFAHMAAIVHADLANNPALADQILDRLEVRILTIFRRFDLPISSSGSEGEEEAGEPEEDDYDINDYDYDIRDEAVIVVDTSV